jgi:hypothetical protein
MQCPKKCHSVPTWSQTRVYIQGRSQVSGELWQPPYLSLCTCTRYICINECSVDVKKKVYLAMCMCWAWSLIYLGLIANVPWTPTWTGNCPILNPRNHHDRSIDVRAWRRGGEARQQPTSGGLVRQLHDRCHHTNRISLWVYLLY